MQSGFDRSTYREKVDFLAVFWGMMHAGGGMFRTFPHVTASRFPGWTFNVIIAVFGEEAFLAVVCLFTVRYFNSHFRPDKIPLPGFMMFTGKRSLEEFDATMP